MGRRPVTAFGKGWLVRLRATSSVAQDRLIERQAGAATLVVANAAGAAAAAGVAWAVWRSPVLADPASTGVIRGLIVLALVASGTFIIWQRPASALGPVVLVLAVSYTLAALSGFGTPGVYTLGRIFLAAFWLLYLYVALAFPRGVVDDPSERRVFAAISLVLAALWIVDVLFATRTPPGAILTACVQHCPGNPYAVLGGEASSDRLGAAIRAATAAAAVAVSALLVRRFWAPSPPAALCSRVCRSGLVALTLTFGLYEAWQPGGTTATALKVLAVVLGGVVFLAFVTGRVRAPMVAAWRLHALVRDALSGCIGVDDIEGRLRSALGDPTLTVTLGEPAEHADEPDRITRPLVFGDVVLGSVSYAEATDEATGLAQGLTAAALACHVHTGLVHQLGQTKHAAATALRERAQLERDLHDGAVQRALGLQLGLARARRHTRDVVLVSELALLESHALLLREDLRRLAHGLYPAVLSERGIGEALVEATAGLSDRVSIAGSIDRLPPDVEHALYHAALEAIQNVVVHAGSWTSARVELAAFPDAATLEVHDDGVGFESTDARGGGFGLRSMRERVAAVGGTVEIRSSPGLGTCVRLSVPRPEAGR